MKANKCFMMIFLGLMFFPFYGMKRINPLYNNSPEEIYNAKVQAYFAPNDRKAMKDDLFSLFDNAKNAIYAAMYWITDDSLIDRLIAAKDRNVQVELYIDQSSPNLYIEKLLNNNIVPIVFPSGPQIGIMHNKFFIIDYEVVFTGSANFTKAAFDETSLNSNRENSIVIRSYEVASAFLKEFINTQVAIFDCYIDMISNYEQHTLPKWLIKLWPTLFKKEGRLLRAFNSRMNQYGSEDMRWIRAYNFKNTVG